VYSNNIPNQLFKSDSYYPAIIKEK